MPSSGTGGERSASLMEDFGAGVVLERLSYSEEIDRPFQILLVVRTSGGEVDFAPHLGKSIDIRLNDEDGEQWFNGILCEAEFSGVGETGVAYSLSVRSFMDVLQIGVDCRIFQGKRADEIILEVAKLRGFAALDFSRLQKPPTKREYCVQYRESDYQFISRLLEEEGISYTFVHERGRHTAVFVDDPGARLKCPQSPLRYARASSGGRSAKLDEPHIWRWAERVRLRPNKMTLADFDFAAPAKPLKAEASAMSGSAGGDLEVYDHPGEFDAKSDRPAIARRRLEAASADRRTIVAEGNTFTLRCGQVFKLQDHETTRHDQDHLVRRLSLTIVGETYRSGQGGEACLLAFEATPTTNAWRPALTYQKPVIPGFQTAIVTGPPGEKVHVDEYGRVKVRFPWDRSRSEDKDSSCWLRVSQFWADNTFGAMTIPRIGEEVVVSFLEGDPDRPLIVGRVYNAEKKVPLDLPKQNTQSIWRSQTIGTTGPYAQTKNPPKGVGFNEISFEDNGGKEQIYMHAQRDMRVAVRFDDIWEVGHDQELDVGNNRLMVIGKDDSEEVVGSQSLKVGKDRAAEVSANESLKVGSKMKVDVGATLEIEAKSKVTITCGTSKIEMTPQGVKIDAMTIELNAKVALKTNGLTAEHKAGAMMTINGALVKIN
jgi:type VI secretion system secreted protein VgrG